MSASPRLPHPDAIKTLDIRTTWSVEKARVGYRLCARGVGICENSPAFAFTRKGAERKARRWSQPQPRPVPRRPSPMQGETNRSGA